jgi:hypothetical protein
MHRIVLRTSAAILNNALMAGVLAGGVMVAEVESSASLPVLLLPEVVLMQSSSAALVMLCDGDLGRRSGRGAPVAIEAVAALPAAGSACVAGEVASAQSVGGF